VPSAPRTIESVVLLIDAWILQKLSVVIDPAVQLLLVRRLHLAFGMELNVDWSHNELNLSCLMPLTLAKLDGEQSTHLSVSVKSDANICRSTVAQRTPMK
jgi:hypothetical protein